MAVEITISPWPANNGDGSSEPQIPADWAETNEAEVDYIKNKPAIALPVHLDLLDKNNTDVQIARILIGHAQTYTGIVKCIVVAQGNNHRAICRTEGYFAVARQGQNNLMFYPDSNHMTVKVSTDVNILSVRPLYDIYAILDGDYMKLYWRFQCSGSMQPAEFYTDYTIDLF